ncbi:MAG: hypothetical protein B7Y55_02140 [Polynucleobacter sp. 35-46-207]|nr:MAG: hypothetical protein B7Y55_02140 [Polynucleobacter sp. 35-46-207]
MTGLEIAALVAMFAGAAQQYQASQEAQSRQQQAITNSLNAQEELQKKAEISNEITAGLIAPVSESQQIRSENSGVQGNVSGDYNSAKATADLNTLKTAESMARLLGKTTSSNRLRMNEGVDLMNAGQNIDQLNNFSRGQKAADSIAIQQAGQIDPTKVFIGNILQAAGSAGMMYKPAAGVNAGVGLNPSGGGFGIGSGSSSGIGIKPPTSASPLSLLGV